MGGSGGEILVGGGGGKPECVVFDSAAALAPLDVFIMLDSSGSMGFAAQGGLTKWDVVSDAFQTFANDPDSAALGVALAFFPIIDPSYNSICAVGFPGCEPNECKPFDVCTTQGPVCESTQDCIDEGFPNDTCDPYGLCGGQTFNGACKSSTDCNNPNLNCEPAGSCWSYYTCPSGPYQVPAFGVSKLPAAGNGLVQTIDAKTPVGGTPTLPALQGAIDGAVGFAANNPSHNVIVVLATDGTPTVCDQDIDGPDPTLPIANVANVAAVGQTQGVQTFVIGVFGPDDIAEAQMNLDTIAQAGAGQNAYVISTGNNQSTTALVQALNDIRENAKSCEFEVVPGEDPIDYSTVWVRITDDMGETWVPRVDGPSQCGPNGGFYYDTPITQGQIPSRIILCGASCALIDDAAENPAVEVFSQCDDPMNQGGGGAGG
jgi:hypothetical protein